MSDNAVKSVQEGASDPRLNDATLQVRFAREWHKRPTEPYYAARLVFPMSRDVNVMCAAVQLWREHPVVVEERNRLASLGASSQLPTKEEIALMLWEKTQEAGQTVGNQLALVREINNMMGHYAPKNSNVTLNDPNGVVNRVMRVPAFGTEGAWHDAAQSQQAALINEAAGATQH